MHDAGQRGQSQTCGDEGGLERALHTPQEVSAGRPTHEVGMVNRRTHRNAQRNPVPPAGVTTARTAAAVEQATPKKHTRCSA